MADYFYALGDERHGPVSLEELRAAPLDPYTLVWREGMPDWEPARRMSELADLFDHPSPGALSTPPPPPGKSVTEPSYRSRGDSDAAGERLDDLRPARRQTFHDPMGGAPAKAWLLESILATVLCCMPFGIPGIVNAAKVEAYNASGDFTRAEHHSREAKKWTLIALGIGLLFYGGYAAVFGTAMLGAFSAVG